ncbi:unnamed protein product [Cladocopium goreaui]|uniref:Peptidyl-prolyl cis-trans isomerase n=1 Tax=Cladocopium goreaui TaxID=2562237 RepID=A0A9P1M0Z8_9DINO|nr:unnamed protein product [Cladocopium goreaui]
MALAQLPQLKPPRPVFFAHPRPAPVARGLRSALQDGWQVIPGTALAAAAASLAARRKRWTPQRAIMWHDDLDALAPVTKKVYMDIAGGDFQGRIVLGLYADLVPKTCENFRALCSGEKDFSYKGSCFHRIFFDFMVQGGRLEGNNESIYGGRFEDEESGSQFYITTAKTEWLDGEHVIFGEVLDGKDVILSMEKCATESGDPSQEICIIDCGEL